MTKDDSGQDSEYDLTPPPPPPENKAPKPGDPDWVPPVPVVEKADPTTEDAPPPDPDIEKHKGMAVLGYICFLIPLVAAPNSKFARYHANQGLLLFIMLVVAVTAVTIMEGALWLVARFMAIAILAFFFSCGLHLLQVALLVAWVVLAVMGIINAANGLQKPLPGVGIWTLIK